MKNRNKNNRSKWSSRSTIVGIFSMLLIGFLFYIEHNPGGAAPYIVAIYTLMIGSNKTESLIKNVISKKKQQTIVKNYGSN